MVWALFPADPLPGEESYYFFSKGTYKVGRKGCDVIVNKDKGVSRIHAEIVIDAMNSMDNLKKKSSVKSSNVKIKDCSKYGTFIKKPLGSKEKVHDFPNKVTTMDDGDFVSFGTGNATYRFSFIGLQFFPCGLESAQVKRLKEKISSIGASMTSKWSPECTHVLVDDFASVNEDMVDAIVAKRPFVSYKWIEFIAEKTIGTEITNSSFRAPALVLEGISVKVADPTSCENCLGGYTFVLESPDKYKVKHRLQTLVEAFGAKVVPVEEFFPNSQGMDNDENKHAVHVIPVGVGDGDGSTYSLNLSSLPKVNEINLICATLSGHLDPSVFISAPVLVISSCSTDETVVADSDQEVEITSVHTSAAVHKIDSIEDEQGNVAASSLESIKPDNELDMTVHSVEPVKFNSERNAITDETNAKSNDDQLTSLQDIKNGIFTRERKIDDSESGNSDIIFSQDLIVRDTSLPLSEHSPMKNQVLNFKRFRKTGTQSGNSFHNLIPFSKYPYKDSEYENEEVRESVKEEKKRKQLEAVAEDLFNTEKGKRRGVPGSLWGLFAPR